jgi:hypothetical protein
VSRASSPVFLFYAPGPVFCGNDGVGSRFLFLRSRTHFGRYRWRRVPFSFCAPGRIFGGTEAVWSRFHVLNSMIRFRRYQGCRVPFSCFALPDPFSTVPTTLGPVFMFCAPGLIFGGYVGSWTRFRLYRARRVTFSCFALPDSFPAVPRALGPVFMFCAPGLGVSGNGGVGPRFHVLRSRTRFRRYRGRRVPFLIFALPNSISMVPTASGFVFMFCAPGPVFGGTGGVGYRFHVLRSRTHFRRYRGHQVPFSCFSLSDPSFHGTDGVGCGFHVLRSKTQFRRYRGRWVPFSCFALPEPFSTVPRHRVPLSYFALHNSFSALPRASSAVFMFCAPRLDFGGTEGVGFRFHVLRSRTHFRRYRWRRVPILCFALPDSFSVVPRASSPVFSFYAPGPVFCGTVGVGYRFLILRSRKHFGWYRWRRVPFSCFALPAAFSAVPRPSGLVFIFCAP